MSHQVKSKFGRLWTLFLYGLAFVFIGYIVATFSSLFSKQFSKESPLLTPKALADTPHTGADGGTDTSDSGDSGGTSGSCDGFGGGAECGVDGGGGDGADGY